MHSQYSLFIWNEQALQKTKEGIKEMQTQT